MVKKVRNGEIDILRFLFAIFIFLHHFGCCGYQKEILKKGYLGVEFFFLLTGYFMARNAKRFLSAQSEFKALPLSQEQITAQTWHFLLNKIKSFYPYYLFAVCIKLVFVLFTTPLKKALELIFKSLPTFLLLLYPLNWSAKGVYVTATWFLSAMIISIFLLYPLLIYKEKIMSGIVFPILSFFLLGYLWQKYKTLNVHGQYITFCYTGVLRAISEIALGVFVAFVSENLDKKIGDKATSLAKLFFTAVKYMIFAVIIIYIAVGGNHRKLDLHVLLFLCVALVLSVSQLTHKIRGSELTDFLGKASLIVYIFHGVLFDISKKSLELQQLEFRDFAILSAVNFLLCFVLHEILQMLIFFFSKSKNNGD